MSVLIQESEINLLKNAKKMKKTPCARNGMPHGYNCHKLKLKILFTPEKA